jgi:hypothetical protein
VNLTIPTIGPVETVEDLRLSVQASLRRLVSQINESKQSDAFDVNNNRIVNVKWPVSNLDAVNVEYLKDFIDHKGKRRVVNNGGIQPITWIARAILPGVQVVANDVLAHRYRVDLRAGQSVNLIFVAVTAKVIPISTDYIADVQVSTDGGTTFNSLLPSGDANKVVLPVSGLNWAVITPTWDISHLTIGDQLRVDILQADGIVSGVEVVLVGVITP